MWRKHPSQHPLSAAVLSFWSSIEMSCTLFPLRGSLQCDKRDDMTGEVHVGHFHSTNLCFFGFFFNVFYLAQRRWSERTESPFFWSGRTKAPDSFQNSIPVCQSSSARHLGIAGCLQRQHAESRVKNRAGDAPLHSARFKTPPATRCPGVCFYFRFTWN